MLPCAASIQAQAVSYMPNPIAERLGFRFEPTPENIDAVARHVAQFSIAGVRAVGRMAPNGMSGHLFRRKPAKRHR